MKASHGALARRSRRDALKPAQELVLEELADGRDEITRAEYERIGHVSRSQAAYDLAELVDRNVLERVGSGRSTRYRPARSRSGRPRSWTDERILTALQAFCAGRALWPSAAEFRSSGHGSLYLAVCRYGGIDRWADALGLPRDEANPDAELLESRNERAQPVRVWHRLAQAAGTLAALAGIAGFALWVPGEKDEPAQPAEPAAASREPAAPGDRQAPRQLAAGGHALEAVVVDLIGKGGDSQVRARRNTRDGRLLFRGVLRAGTSVQVEGRRIWIRLERPRAVRLLVDGNRVAHPRRAHTILVTENGVRVVRTAPRKRETPPAATTNPAEIPVSVIEPAAAAPSQTPPLASGSGSESESGSGSSSGGGSPSPEPVAEEPGPDPRP